MRLSSLLLTLTLGLAAGAAGVAALARLDRLPPALRHQPSCPPQPKPCPAPPSAALTPPPAAPASQPVAAPNPSEPTATPAQLPAVERVLVCESSRTLPTLRLLRLDANARPLAAVHCGESVQLMAFDGAGDGLVARRIARIDLHAPTPDLLVQPAELVAADVDADGRTDLLVPFWWQDKTAAPRGGAVYELVRDPSSGFAAPKLLASVAARAIASGHFDASPGADLALTSFEDPRVGRNSELLLMHGGPAPLKALTLALGNDVRDLLALDLDLDGHDDLLVAAAKPSLELLYLTGEASLRTRASLAALDATQLRRLVAADLDGDGHDDALLIGDTLHVLLAAAGGEPKLQELAVSDPVRSAFPVDLNADGKLDLVVTTRTGVLALVQTTALRFETKPLLQLPPDLLAADAAALSTELDGRFALLVLTLPAGKTTAELAIAALGTSVPPSWPARPTPLRDAPLSLRLSAH